MCILSSFESEIGISVYCRGPICLEGNYMWKLKDKIDRNWISGYKTLGSMLAPMNAPITLSKRSISSETLRSDSATSRSNGEGSSVLQLSPEVASLIAQQQMR
jgi:hypothetical protein